MKKQVTMQDVSTKQLKPKNYAFADGSMLIERYAVRVGKTRVGTVMKTTVSGGVVYYDPMVITDGARGDGYYVAKIQTSGGVRVIDRQRTWDACLLKVLNASGYKLVKRGGGK